VPGRSSQRFLARRDLCDIDRAVACEASERAVERGIDMRLEYEDDHDLLRSQLVTEGNVERTATTADRWLRE